MVVHEPVAVEFVYDAAFRFDILPNNQPQPNQEQQEQQEQHGIRVQPKWHRTAIAPVPFDEDVFWKVLERWILETPSVIPPVSKVEIISDVTKEAAGTPEETASPSNLSSSSPYTLERERLLLDGLDHPFRTIRRRLLPKRADKDPVMEEQLYYCRVQKEEHQTSGSSGTLMTKVADDKSDTSSYAIFAPIIVNHGNSKVQDEDQNQGQDQDQGQGQDEIKILTADLPFYYPKVRGLRYGYRSDPDEALENMEDHHQQEQGCLCHHEDLFEHSDLRNLSTNSKMEKGGGKISKNKEKVMSKRAGWITLDLFLAGDEGEFTSKMQYAFKELFKKLYKWGVNTTKGFTKSRVQHDVLVPKDMYLSTYARMKENYAQKWVQSWPEKTDPRKFVFEDIAIAAWLVALWELERISTSDDNKSGTSGDQQEDTASEKETMKKQTFVDLGCGNGLLTHILNEEGHKGTGIDIASRKVWDIYGKHTNLEAQTIIPNETVFDDVDWVIGNHADELAPWIPIIASRSKPRAKFVVIPCCFFDMNGSRYQFPKGAPEGKYKAYQDYICEVIDTCGYHLETEILRIPSTKNVALVGRSRKRKRGEYDDKEDEEAQMRRVDTMVMQSGLFVPRISDKDKQVLQKSKQSAKLTAKEGVQHIGEHEAGPSSV
ncbi:tRNA methyltransferase 44 [Mortierella sp. GBA30]|nr:tRNA methyltransferase 44 [Mortierella sp. GBA30]